MRKQHILKLHGYGENGATECLGIQSLLVHLNALYEFPKELDKLK